MWHKNVLLRAGRPNITTGGRGAVMPEVEVTGGATRRAIKHKAK